MVVGGGEEDGENYISGNIPGTYQQKDLLVLEAISSSDYENDNADGKKKVSGRMISILSIGTWIWCFKARRESTGERSQDEGGAILGTGECHNGNLILGNGDNSRQW